MHRHIAPLLVNGILIAGGGPPAIGITGEWPDLQFTAGEPFDVG